MEHVDLAIVLGAIEVKNNNNVVKFFTRNNGKVAVYVSAGTKKKAAKNAVLQPLSICQITYSTSKNSSIPKLKEARIEKPLLNIQMDISKSTIALFIAEFLQQILPEEQDEEQFEFLTGTLEILNEIQDGKGCFHLSFLLKCMRWVGIQPQILNERNNYFDLQEGSFKFASPNHPYYLGEAESGVVLFLLKSDWLQLGNLKITSAQKRRLLQAIMQYYKLHLTSFKKPQSLAILEEVFS